MMDALCAYAAEKDLIVIDSRSTDPPNASVLYKSGIDAGCHSFYNHQFIDDYTSKRIKRWSDTVPAKNGIVLIGHIQNDEPVSAYIEISKRYDLKKISELI